MTRTYVVPDIHGRFDLLTKALASIEASPSGGTVVFTGDYVDRGHQSKEVLDLLMAGPSDPERWTWVCLKGNHEDMMAGAIVGDYQASWWIGNGGGETMVSLGEIDLRPYVDWINKLPLSFRDKHRIYVHAGIDPTLPFSEQDEQTLLWKRVAKTMDYTYGEGYIVHGHTPFDDGPIVLEGRANLDTGAFFTGRLVVAVFDDDKPGMPQRILTFTALAEAAE